MAGIGMFGAYALILVALRLAAAAPVAAVRETSIVIATLLGAVVLHETVGRARMLGSVVIVLGVGAIALA
jgi:drug/metabolite transporter (DMT)-like permease